MMQIVQQTRDEKISMYMRTQKRKLAEMLVNCNEIIEALQSHNSESEPLICSCGRLLHVHRSCPICDNDE